MTKRFRKSDITVHHGYDYSGPAINVKVYQFPANVHPAHDTVMIAFGCDRELAGKALEYAYESAQRQFWSKAEAKVKEIFGDKAEAYAMGRSSGWLYVSGIDPHTVSWSAVMVAKWGRLVRWVEDTIAALTSWDFARGEVEHYLEMAQEEKQAERVRDAAPQMLEALKGLLANAPKPKHIRTDFSYTLYLEAARTAVRAAEGSTK